MSSTISIPVSPLIMSLFNECKENLKYADKSNTDFLIFLLNSSMHIFSIVREFSPILQDAVGSTCNTENNASQLQELEKKSNGFLSPAKATAAISAPQDEETVPNGLCQSDDEISIDSLNYSPHRSPSQNIISKSAISDHFANYSKPSHISSSTPKKPKLSCPKCSASFSFQQGLQRHLSKNSCEYHMKRKRKLSLLNNHSNSAVVETKKKRSSKFDENGDVSNDDSVESTGPDLSGTDLFCPDCGKTFNTIGNLNRHVKLSKSCGSVELFSDYNKSTSLPNEASDEIPPTAFQCSFCKSVLSTEKSYNVHRKRFRCKRRCKFCEFTASQSIFVQSHLRKEHNSLMSIDEIEEHNKQLFLKHINELETTQTSPDPVKNEWPQLCCPVYQCNFSTIHKCGQVVHIKHHKAEIADSGKELSNCETCDMIGIPKEVLNDHKCLNPASDCKTESPALDKENGDATNESQVDDKLLHEEEKDPQKKKSSPKKKVPVSLKHKKKSSPASIAIPPLKLATHRTSPKKKSKLTLKKKIINKSADTPCMKCKYCDFVGASHKHLAGHMNVHKIKRSRINSAAKSDA